jgi:hypothetical protein
MEVRNEVDVATAGLPEPSASASRPKVAVYMTNMSARVAPASTRKSSSSTIRSRGPSCMPADGAQREGVSGQYDIPGKKEVLAAHGFKQLGPAMRKLLEVSDTSYYNPNAKRY